VTPREHAVAAADAIVNEVRAQNKRLSARAKLGPAHHEYVLAENARLKVLLDEAALLLMAGPEAIQ
jgi:hypothetical protein